MNELKLRKRIRKIVKSIWGFIPRGFQEDVAVELTAGRDVFLVIATGGGKSLTYQIPAAFFVGTVVVFSPLISLMKDQVDTIKKLSGLKAVRVDSTQSEERQVKIQRRLKRGKYDLIYVSPERLKNRAFREALMETEISLVAVDEAHCLSKYGKDFRSAYNLIGPFVQKLGVPVLTVTATADSETEKDVTQSLNMQDYARMVSVPNRPNLRYRTQRDLGISELYNTLRKFSGGKIVYCSSRKKTEKLAEELSSYGLEVEPYHAGLEKKRRNTIQDDFISGDLDCIVATNAFGMGVDKSDIRCIIHHDIPGSLFDYLQEAGRAGRDGDKATCYVNVTKLGISRQKGFIRNRNPELWLYERLWKWIPKDRPLVTTVARLAKKFNLNYGGESQIESALQYMEYRKLIASMPGKLSYDLKVKNVKILRKKFKGLGIRAQTEDVFKLTIAESDYDPVSDMIKLGAVYPAFPNREIVVKRKTNSLLVTSSELEAKRADALYRLDQMIDFTVTNDKVGYIKRLFLEG